MEMLIENKDNYKILWFLQGGEEWEAPIQGISGKAIPLLEIRKKVHFQDI